MWSRNMFGSEIRDKTCFDLISYGFELRHIDCRDCIHEIFLLVLSILLFYTSTCYIVSNMYFGMQPFVYMIISCPVLNAHCGRYCFNFVSNLIITRRLKIHAQGWQRSQKIRKSHWPSSRNWFFNLLSPSSNLDAYQ